MDELVELIEVEVVKDTVVEVLLLVEDWDVLIELLVEL